MTTHVAAATVVIATYSVGSELPLTESSGRMFLFPK